MEIQHMGGMQDASSFNPYCTMSSCISTLRLHDTNQIMSPILSHGTLVVVHHKKEVVTILPKLILHVIITPEFIHTSHMYNMNTIVLHQSHLQVGTKQIVY